LGPRRRPNNLWDIGFNNTADEQIRGVKLSYKTFGKIREVNRAEIVESKHLGPALELAAKIPAEREIKRSQREHMFSNPEHTPASQ